MSSKTQYQVARVRPATHADLPYIVATLGTAYMNEPLAAWIVGKNCKHLKPILKGYFYAIADAFYLPSGGVLMTEDRTGAMFWLPQTVSVQDLRITKLPQLFWPMIRYGGAASIGMIRRIMIVSSLTENKHPHEPHCYVYLLGVHPKLQGRGIGSALLDEFIACCDHEQCIGYIETATPLNRVLYERYGFQVVDEIIFPEEGPRIWCMVRQPVSCISDG